MAHVSGASGLGVRGSRRGRLLAFAVAASVSGTAFAPAAHAQPRTTAPSGFVNIRVTLTDTRIVVSTHTAPRGTYARFIIHNIGTKPHAFTLGKAPRGTGSQSGFSRTLQPGARKILILFLDYRGRIPYFSSLPGDLPKSAMKGTFMVGDCISASVGCGADIPG
jgi:hypothetical protein